MIVAKQVLDELIIFSVYYFKNSKVY